MLAPSKAQAARRRERGWDPVRAATQPVQVQVRGDRCPGSGPAAGRCAESAQGGPSVRGRYCEECAAWLFGERAA